MNIDTSSKPKGKVFARKRKSSIISSSEADMKKKKKKNRDDSNVKTASGTTDGSGGVVVHGEGDTTLKKKKKKEKEKEKEKKKKEECSNNEEPIVVKNKRKPRRGSGNYKKGMKKRGGSNNSSTAIDAATNTDAGAGAGADDDVGKQKSSHERKSNSAIEYMLQWNDHRDTWKFQKLRQAYLLSHWHDPAVVDKSSFKILRKYLNGLKGGAQDILIKEARFMLENCGKLLLHDADNTPKSTVENDNKTEEVDVSHGEANMSAEDVVVLRRIREKRASVILNIFIE